MSAMRRKIEAGRPAAEAPAIAGKALGQALMRAAQDLMQLPLTPVSAEDGHAILSAVAEAAAEHSLLLLLDHPEKGQGLAAIDAGLLAALVEVQTTGRLGPAVPPARAPTRTDAAIAGLFLSPVLAAAGEPVAQYRPGAVLAEARTVGLTLPECAYRVLRAEVALGPAGMRSGRLYLAVPSGGKGEPVAGAPAADGAGDWAARIAAQAAAAPVCLTAVLWRAAVPLSEVLSLAAGSVIPVPPDALDRLSVEGLDGRRVMTGRLGQARGARAVRISAIGDERSDPAAGAALPDQPDLPDLTPSGVPAGLPD